MEPEQTTQPYAEYTVEVEAEGYRPVSIEGVDVFSGELSLQNVRMEPTEVLYLNRSLIDMIYLGSSQIPFLHKHLFITHLLIVYAIKKERLKMNLQVSMKRKNGET